MVEIIFVTHEAVIVKLGVVQIVAAAAAPAPAPAAAPMVAKVIVVK